MLIVMEHRDVEQLPQPLLDHKALGRADVLQIDATPALAQQLDAIHDLIRILGGDFEIDGVDIGKALEQNRLALHHGFRRQCPAIAKAKDGSAIGDDRDKIAFGGVVEGAALVLGNRKHRDGNAWRIRKGEVALGGHRLCRHHFELAGPALAVKQQRFLVGKGRPLAAAVVFCSHFSSLAVQTGQLGGGGDRT